VPLLLALLVVLRNQIIHGDLPWPMSTGNLALMDACESTLVFDRVQAHDEDEVPLYEEDPKERIKWMEQLPYAQLLKHCRPCTSGGVEGMLEIGTLTVIEGSTPHFGPAGDHGSFRALLFWVAGPKDLVAEHDNDSQVFPWSHAEHPGGFDEFFRVITQPELVASTPSFHFKHPFFRAMHRQLVLLEKGDSRFSKEKLEAAFNRLHAPISTTNS
jgi:hypothetical protein